ncbi:helix-turn-helix domain-containing protein [Streptomyces sp. NPDC059850]|uniref:helix-turn-helix domain-containing protein n=1 Tax=Streptomyces sp. NPDC059850 TaxID=3346970 RepID=UPI003662FF61
MFDSKDFPARDVLDAWTDAIQDTVMPTHIRLVDIDVFRGCFKAMPLGPVQVSAAAYSSFCTIRTPKLIRTSDPEYIQISLIRAGAHAFQQDRHEVGVRPCEFLIWSSSRPFTSFGDGESLLLQFPRALLPLAAEQLDQIMACPLPGDQGMGRLLADFLTHLAKDGAGYTPQDAARLGTVGLDLAAAFLAHHLDREGDIPADSRQRALYLRIVSFIQHRLGDATLTAGAIAAAHHISVRSLHRLFQQHGVSVRSWMRGQRLEHCRRDLADPVRRHMPIRGIAARWGFPRPADFTRAFRATYGISPSEYRDQQRPT